MSIADKLIYLNGTKDKLKDSINNIGGSIDENTTFRNYVTELDTIYDNLPKTTGEGSNLSLTTLKGRINVDDILGDTEQDSTTGANLLIPSLTNVDTGTTITKSNYVSSLTISDNEFTFVASGSDMYWGQVTGTGGSYSASNGNKISVGSATKISFRVTNSAFNRAHFTPYDSNNVSLGYTGIQGNTGTYTIPSGTSYVTFRFGKNDATSGTTYKTKVIVALGDTIPDYQDYTGGQASPNPTYPQDINVVTGTQEVVVSNSDNTQSQTKTLHLSSKNVCPTNASEWEAGQYNVSTGTKETQEHRVRLKNLMPVLPNTTYYVTTNNSNYSFVFRSYDKNGNYLSSYGGVGNNGTITTTTSQSQGIYYLGTIIYNPGGEATETSQNIIDKITSGNIKPFICLNTETDKTYEPYYNYELAKIGIYQDRISKSSGKQLFDKNDYTKGFYFNSNGEIVSGTNWGYAYVPCEPNTTYIASGMKNYSTPSFIEVDENKNFVANLFNKTGESSKTFTTTTGKYIGVSFVWNNSVGNGGEIDTLMLNEGSIALPYEPYGTGWYIEKNIGKYTFTGSENWSYSNSRFVVNDIVDNIHLNSTRTQTICNRYGYVASGSADYGMFVFYSNGHTQIYVYDKDYTTKSAFNTYLASNTTQFYYIANTPTYTKITNETLLNELNELEKMMSYNGTTNISVSGNLPMILDVTALKGE